MLNRPLSLLLRIFFDLLYHQFAWTYDWVAAAVSLGRWKDWLLTTLLYIDGEWVLELGHGPGHLQTALRDKGIRSVGVDESRQMGDLAFSRLRKLGYNPLLVSSRAQSLPFSEMLFQQAVATFPTEYITDMGTLSEIYRVLVPGGKFIVLPVAWISSSALPDRLAAWLFRVTDQAPDWDERLDVRFERLATPFIRAGFQIQVKRQEVRSSQVLIILAEKPHNL